MRNKIKLDIEALLTGARPKLIEAYKNGDTKLYHKISEEFIPVAHRIFMHLYEYSDITWPLTLMFGSKLSNPIFWKYTDFVLSFCDYLKLKSMEEAYA